MDSPYVFFDLADLPDNDALVGSQEHFVTFFDAECIVERIDVLQSGVYAKFTQRMRVYLGQAKDLFVADISSPQAGISQVKALIGCKAVDIFLIRIFRFGFFESRVSHSQTALVGNVFPQGITTIGMYGVEYDFRGVVFGQTVGTLGKLGGVIGSPPIVQVSFLVELATLVVETVRHFMAYHYADRSVVDRIVALRIEERGLQDGCRETNFVGGDVYKRQQ